MRVLWAVGVILSGLVAGGALNNAVAMVPALRRFDEQTDLEVRRAWSLRPVHSFAVAALAAGVAAVALLVFASGLPAAARALLAVAVALGAALLLSIAAARRVELSVRSWNGREPPDGYAAMRRRWRTAQLVMAVASVAMVACYATAAGAAT